MYQLTVLAGDLRQVLQQLKIRKTTAARTVATLSFKDQYGCLEYANARHVFHATGDWPGEARFSASAVYALKHYPPTGPELLIQCDGGTISIGSMRVGADWFHATAEAPNIPLDADWVTVLIMTSKAPHLRRSDPYPVSAAEFELSRRIARAADELSPLGITQSDLRALVEVRLIERR